MFQIEQHHWESRVKALWSITRWFLVGGAIAYLAYQGVFSVDISAYDTIGYQWIVLSVLIIVVTLLGVALRFHYIVRGLGCHSSILHQFRILFSGLLLMQLGSSFAFDALRIVVLRKDGLLFGAISAAILADRIIGVLSLLILAFASSFYLVGMDSIIYPAASIFGIVLLIPLALVLLRYVSQSNRAAFLVRIPGSRFAISIGEAFVVLGKKPLLVCSLILFSIIIQVMILLNYYFISHILPGYSITVAEAIVAGSFASLTGVLPLPGSGVGVGESAFSWLIAKMRDTKVMPEPARVFFINRLLYIMIGIGANVLSLIPSPKRGERDRM